jgi:hypothetical protein
MENDRTHVGLTPVWSPLLVKEAGSLSGGHCQMEEREREERGREREKERQRERERERTLDLTGRGRWEQVECYCAIG